MTAERLRRYTSFPHLIGILQRKKVTLREPWGWDDTNDLYFLKLYKDALNLESLLVLCFTTPHESIAIWKDFAPGPTGVCIEFDKELLLRPFYKNEGFRCESVTYLSRNALKRRNLAGPEQLPFLKRQGFYHESEFRVIYQDEVRFTEKHMPIRLDCIVQVILSPWIHRADFEANAKRIKSIDGCEELPVVPSSLLDSRQWKRLGDRIVKGYDASALDLEGFQGFLDANP